MMSPVGVQAVGTVTVAGSGTELVYPARSNSPFKNLVLQVKPLERSLSTRYVVTLYMDGEVVEEHSYTSTTDNAICNMAFPTMFPANIGTESIPQFYDPDRQHFTGSPIIVQIENLETEQRTFEVYALFEAFDHCRFAKIVQGS